MHFSKTKWKLSRTLRFFRFSLESTDSAGQRWKCWVRRFENYIVAKNNQNDKRMKAMLLHYAGEAVFELSDVVGVIEKDNFAETKRKLTGYFRPQCNEEYGIFKFRPAEQMAAETLDQYNTRLQQLAKHCNFHEKDREVKTQIIQTCAMSKVRDKGLSEPTITLQRLLTFGRTLEATSRKSWETVLRQCQRLSTPYRKTGGGGRRNSACGGFGVAQQMASHTYRNPPRKHFPPDRQGTPHKDNRPVVSCQQRYRRHKSAAPACSGCGGPPHDDRRMCKSWNGVCYKCQKLNHFANVCKANIQQTHLVENDTHSQSSDMLCTTHTHLACITNVLLTQYHRTFAMFR